MDRSMRLFAIASLLLMFFMATEMGPMMVAEALCRGPSGRFKGVCFSSNNCASVCRDEGFPGGGACHNFGCECNKPC